MATLTEVANLALDLIGEPYLTDYANDIGTAADAARLLLPHCQRSLLESHNWAFATAYTQLGAPGGLPDLPAQWASQWALPSNCAKLLTINGVDIDQPVQRFEICGRILYLEQTATPTIAYVATDPAISTWPTTFVDALAVTLASRLAPKLTGNEALANNLLQKAELSLGRAKSKDARETMSAENHGPRQLLAKSPLAQSRFR